MVFIMWRSISVKYDSAQTRLKGWDHVSQISDFPNSNTNVRCFLHDGFLTREISLSRKPLQHPQEPRARGGLPK